MELPSRSSIYLWHENVWETGCCIQHMKKNSTQFMSVTTVKHTSKSSVQRFDVSHTFPVYNPDKQCKHLGLYTLIQITLYTSLCSRIKTRVPQVMQRTAKAHTSVWQKMSLIYTKRVYLCIMSLTHILTMQSQ